MRIPRGIRNNNPGCLRMPGTNGKRDKEGYAIFDTFEAGYYALNGCLYRVYNGKTLRQIFKHYAPASEVGNEPGEYSLMVAATLKKMGYNVGVNTPLDFSDPNIRAAVVVGIAKVECGKIPGGKAFAMAQSRAYDPTTDPKNKKINQRRKKSGLAKRSTRAKSPAVAEKSADGVDVRTKRTNLDKKINAKGNAPITQTNATAFANQKEAPTTKTGAQGISYWGLIASPRLGGATQEEIQQATLQLVENNQLTKIEPPKRLSWFKRVFPSFLGGASVEDKLLNKAYYPDGKNLDPKMAHVFKGVSVGDLMEAGFSQDKIKDMQQRINAYEQQMGLKARLGQSAQVQMRGEDIGLTADEVVRIHMIQQKGSAKA